MIVYFKGWLGPETVLAGLLKIPICGEEPAAVQQQYRGAEHGHADNELADVFNRTSEAVDISMLMPLSSGDNAVRSGFVEFYEGALIAANELRSQGLNVNMSLFDTERSPEVISKIIRTEAFRTSDVIIGPVYEDEIGPVMKYSERTGIGPIFSCIAG